MNGQKYCEYVKGSKDWDEKVAKSNSARWQALAKKPRALSAYKITMILCPIATSSFVRLQLSKFNNHSQHAAFIVLTRNAVVFEHQVLLCYALK